MLRFPPPVMRLDLATNVQKPGPFATRSTYKGRQRDQSMIYFMSKSDKGVKDSDIKVRLKKAEGQFKKCKEV